MILIASCKSIDSNISRDKYISCKYDYSYFDKKYDSLDNTTYTSILPSFLKHLSNNCKFHRKKDTEVVKNLVFNLNTQNIQHNIELLRPEFSFALFRSVIIYKLPKFNNPNFNQILVDYYYGSFDEKELKSPEKLFLKACKTNSILLPEGTDIIKQENNALEVKYTYDDVNKTKGQIKFSAINKKDNNNVILEYSAYFYVFKQNQIEYWLPYELKITGFSDVIWE